MPEKTAADAGKEIEAAFAAYARELEQAGPHWEKKPAVSGEGEGAWCARQVAEHIASAGLLFGDGIAQAVGTDAPAVQRQELPDAGAAMEKTRETHGELMKVVSTIRDDQMAIEVDHPRLGKQTIGGILGVVSYHLNDHAAQLKALRGA